VAQASISPMMILFIAASFSGAQSGGFLFTTGKLFLG